MFDKFLKQISFSCWPVDKGTEASNWNVSYNTENIFYTAATLDWTESFIFQRTEFLLERLRLVRLREAINRANWAERCKNKHRAASSCVVLQRQSAVTSHLCFLTWGCRVGVCPWSFLFLSNRWLWLLSEWSSSSQRSSWSPFTGSVNMQLEVHLRVTEAKT